jgi:hypothetical protein
MLSARGSRRHSPRAPGKELRAALGEQESGRFAGAPMGEVEDKTETAAQVRLMPGKKSDNMVSMGRVVPLAL